MAKKHSLKIKRLLWRNFLGTTGPCYSTLGEGDIIEERTSGSAPLGGSVVNHKTPHPSCTTPPLRASLVNLIVEENFEFD